MKNNYFFVFFLFISFPVFYAHAQPINIDETITGKNMPQINYVFNRVFGDIHSFYDKLHNLKKYDSGIVRIVHIGDSHIQADLFTGVIRKSFQEIFGNAGRGLIFPYQLAGTNAPPDINSSSNTRWQFNELTHPEKNPEPGISGYCIQTDRPGASIDIFLKADGDKDQTFDKINFFIDGDTASSWTVHAGNSDTNYILYGKSNNPVFGIQLKSPANQVSLISSSSSENFFYGASLEKNQPGIMYHSIGVNGARYDQYNNDSLFWKQLPALRADIFIVSLGTNDAQGMGFDEAAFLNQVTLFISHLKKASPGASILLTTSGDSYKGRYSNSVLRKLNMSLYDYCFKNNIGMWDIYRISNGYGSARSWFRKGLLSGDRVHFTSAGYELQAKLFFIALVKGYNMYSGNY